MTTVRRSARTRHQATSIYDEAKKEIDEKAATSDAETKHDDDSDEEMSNAGDKSGVEREVEADVEEDVDPSGDESSDDDEEDFKPKAPTTKPSSAKKKKKKSPKKTQIRVGREPATRKPKAATGGSGTASRKGIQNALTALGKKVLDETETPENSLVAALLQAYTGASKNTRASQGTTIYTPQLEAIARRVIQEQKNDPNKAQTQLLNLLFRSVGGSVKTNLDPAESILEDMDNEEWAAVVTDLVDEMRHTPPDRILVCADPAGAAHAAAVESGKELDTAPGAPSSMGVREYRKIYEEFWYVLGNVALNEGVASKDGGDESDDDSDDEKNRRKSFTTTTLFDAEVVRDFILRVTELITVGQPDVRAAATVAAMQLGQAVLERTVELGAKLDVATRQYEAATSGKKDSRLSKKAASFQQQMDSLKRTKADLEEMVFGSVIQGVFMHRYRDSNLFIRATTLKSLEKMVVERPDLFLYDKYLKYFGWLVTDHAATGRVAGLEGLHAPFLALGKKKSSRKNPIDLSLMENCITKFLPKIADAVLDVNLLVQEKAMTLLLTLEREGFLDNVTDENLWTQINLRALSPQTTPAVRRDALYFVMDQLEAFDEDETQDEKSGQKRGRSKDKASLAESSERMMVQRIDALAAWAGEIIVDGPVPIDKIRVHLADYMVQSLREMPEHKALVTNWNAMLRAIGDDSTATTSGDKAEDRAEVAKQRVLVQMLAYAAQAEVVAVSQEGFLERDVDPDEADVQAVENALALPNAKKSKGKSKAYSGGMAHEVLSVSLLSSLPDLLIKFKGDPTILGSITLLPRYILPTVFSLSQRKKDVLALIKNLSDIYLESSDEIVLQNIALSLISISQGGHTRASDARLQLQRVASTLVGRLIELLAESKDQGATSKRKSSAKPKKSPKRKRRSDDSLSSDDSEKDEDEEELDSESNDTEYAIRSCLRRLCVLSKRCNLCELLDESASDEDSTAGTVGDLCHAVVTAIEKRLKERVVKVEQEDEDEEPNVIVPEIWKTGDQSMHEVVAGSVKDSLSLLLSITAWKLSMAQKENNLVLQEGDDIVMEEEQDGDEADEHGVVGHRDQLFAMLVLCFEQFLPPVADPSEDEPMYSKEQISFSDQVQNHACQIAGDLRCLFPKEWEEASSPLLRAAALTNDHSAAGGLVRYLRSKEEQLRVVEDDQEGINLGSELLLPLARSVATNWKLGNRREAGVALAHVTGSGAEAGKLVLSLSRVLKKIDSVRLLEAHMASLRQGYEEWMLNEPEEPQSDRPTDAEMDAFTAAEKKHDAEFQLLEQQAARLSSSLGVGKLRDPKLAPSLLGFLRNGIKFAFSNDDGDLVLGGRLTFLTIMSKYANWIRKNKEQQNLLREDLENAEKDLRADPDFEEVHEDDLKAITAFRSALHIKEATRQQETSPRSITDDSMGDDYSDEGDSVTRASVGTNRSRFSHGGASVSSVRSKLSSAMNSLSPLPEEDASMEESPDDDDDHDSDTSPPPAKRRSRGKRVSVASTLSVSTVGQSQPTIAEGSDESDDGSY